MRNFLQIADNLDVTPLLLEVHRQPALWNQYPYRTHHTESPHREAEDILVRCQPIDRSWPDHRECLWYPAAAVLPSVRAHAFALMTRVQGERLGRIVITRLAPGTQIYPHADIGVHPLHYDTEPYYQRFHTLLQCPRGARFVCGEESVWMPSGTCWTFDNTQEHAVINDGQEDRITLIVDIQTKGHWLTDVAL